MSNFNPTIEIYSELQHAFDFYNQKIFGSQLPRALITIESNNWYAGFFSSKEYANHAGNPTVDLIMVNHSYFRDIVNTLGTLVHEIPQMGTNDIAQWFIIIELDKTFRPREYTVKIREVIHTGGKGPDGGPAWTIGC